MIKQVKLRLKDDHRVLLLLTLWSAVVLMLMSMDSPLHHIYNRCDSAWFFMCGKAMMNGLRPYVDFTDSKGPLLWLIYGIGYLISPRNYVGVYVLSCLCYGGILYYNYKTALLLLGDARRALLVALAMPLFYFLYWFHNEVRAEDFCTLPVAASLYCLFRMLYGSGSAAVQPSARRAGLVMGASFMSLVLVKFNIAVMHGVMIAVALYYYFRTSRSRLLPYTGWLAAGMLAVALPFLAYLLYAGSFSGFIQEYFVNTLQTIDTPHGMPETYSEDLEKAWGTPQRQFLMLAIAAGGWLMGRRLTSYRFVPMLVGLFFYAIAVRHSFYYYYSICYIFIIYLLVYMAGLVTKPVKIAHLAMAAAAVVAWGVFNNVRDGSQLATVSKLAAGEERNKRAYEEAQRITKALSVYQRPKVLNLFFYEQGFEVPCEGLPAGRYFGFQNGMTPEMVSGHEALLKSGNADFVIVGDIRRSARRGYTRGVIESFGYQRILTTNYYFEGFNRKTADVYMRRY